MSKEVEAPPEKPPFRVGGPQLGGEAISLSSYLEGRVPARSGEGLKRGEVRQVCVLEKEKKRDHGACKARGDTESDRRSPAFPGPELFCRCTPWNKQTGGA